MQIETLDRPILTKGQMIEAWKTLAREKKNTAEAAILYTLARSLEKTNFQTKRLENLAELVPQALAYLKKSFPPIKNLTKLANGRYPYDTLYALLNQAFYRPATFFAALPVDFSGEAQYNIQQLAKLCFQELTMEERFRRV